MFFKDSLYFSCYLFSTSWMFKFAECIMIFICMMFFFVMIFVLMSGLMTPIESMPAWAQWIIRFLPPCYFVEIMRSVYLKGSLIAELWTNYALLGVFAALFNTLAAVTYRKQA